MIKRACCLLAFAVIFTAFGCDKKDGTSNGGYQIAVKNDPAAQRVDFTVGGKPFTSYLYSDKISVLKKTVLYPIITAGGNTITRKYPLEPGAGERTDHPHQIGFWLNYGDVNGLDFWNNSDAIKSERANEMGTIRHAEIHTMETGDGKGALKISQNWLRPDDSIILQENTRFDFYAAENMRAIDRTTTLTATDQDVLFKDNKEGMIAVRVTRALEHPSGSPVTLTDASGKPTTIAFLNNHGVTGNSLSSEGVSGMDVWGKRAPWVALRGEINSEKVTLALFDHPENVGYPTYWHARGYGLFAANPLGQKIFSEGAEELNFSLKAGESVTFRHRLLIRSGDVSADACEADYQEFTSQH